MYVLWSIEPSAGNGWGLVFFYASFGTAFVGTLTSVGTVLRRFFYPGRAVSRHLLVSFRQAFLLTFLVLCTLLLLAAGWLNGFRLFLLIAFFTLIECAFLSLFRRRTV